MQTNGHRGQLHPEVQIDALVHGVPRGLEGKAHEGDPAAIGSRCLEANRLAQEERKHLLAVGNRLGIKEFVLVILIIVFGGSTNSRWLWTSGGIVCI